MVDGTKEISTETTDNVERITPNDTEVNNIKRKRGRPRKEETTKEDSFSIQEEKVKISHKAKRSKNFMTDSEAKNATEFVLSLIDGFAVSSLGNEAKLNLTEKIILENSLPKLLTSIESNTVEKASTVLYPLAVLTGFSIYAIRLFSIYSEKNLKEQESSENWQESTPITNSNLFSNLGVN